MSVMTELHQMCLIEEKRREEKEVELAEDPSQKTMNCSVVYGNLM